MGRPQPLSDEDLAQINQAVEAVREAKTLIDTAKRAGLDVAEFERRAREAEERLLRLRQAFFPGRSS